MLKPIASALLCGTALLSAPAQASGIYVFHADHILGTSLDATITAAAASLAQAAMDAIHTEIARLDFVLSGWRDDSELAALNRSSSFNASPDLFRLIAKGEAWRERSGGAFSIRLGGLAGASDPGALATDIASADVAMDPLTGEIRRPEPVSFAVDAIAKGYIIDRALEAARSIPGVQGALIDIGGDIACWGLAPCGDGWRIGVIDPSRTADNALPAEMITLRGGAIATSGTGARGHVIYDPLTGKARDGVAIATAFASTATDADALASALYVLPPERGLQLAANTPGAEARIVGADGTVHVTDGWSGLVLAQNMAAPTHSTKLATGSLAWPAGFTAKIDYTVPLLNGGRRVRPPYVTIWITNEAGNPVRTLAFYADKARYMSELYVFWDKIGGGNYGLVNSVTRPTRPPGAYSLEWDGKDDTGHSVPQGRYTVNIEAAREHGGHSLQKIDLDMRTNPTSGDATAQQELGPAKVTYGK